MRIVRMPFGEDTLGSVKAEVDMAEQAGCTFHSAVATGAAMYLFFNNPSNKAQKSAPHPASALAKAQDEGPFGLGTS